MAGVGERDEMQVAAPPEHMEHDKSKQVGQARQRGACAARGGPGARALLCPARRGRTCGRPSAHRGLLT